MVGFPLVSSECAVLVLQLSSVLIIEWPTLREFGVCICRKNLHLKLRCHLQSLSVGRWLPLFKRS